MILFSIKLLVLISLGLILTVFSLQAQIPERAESKINKLGFHIPDVINLAILFVYSRNRCFHGSTVGNTLIITI